MNDLITQLGQLDFGIVSTDIEVCRQKEKLSTKCKSQELTTFEDVYTTTNAELFGNMDLLIQDIQDQVQQNKYPHIKHMKEAQVDIVEQHNFLDNQQDIVEFLNLQDNLD